MAARHVPHPKSIEDYGGRDPYLDATKDLHNGLGAKDFNFRMNSKRKHRPSIASVAEDFDVSTKTIYDWKRRAARVNPADQRKVSA